MLSRIFVTLVMGLSCGLLVGARPSIPPESSPPKPVGPPNTSMYYLMTKVVDGDMSKNGSFVIPIPIISPNSTTTTTTTLPLQNHAALLSPTQIQNNTHLLTPGYITDFYQEFTTTNPDPTNTTLTTIAFSLPAVNIKDEMSYGNVLMSVDDMSLGYGWNAGFSLDEERGLVFTYAGGRVLSGWVVCDGEEELPLLYWMWSETPSLSNDSIASGCAMVELVPVPIFTH